MIEILEKEYLDDGISGIYCIENKINHKKYIGQSVNIRVRWWIHCYDLRNNKHHNCHLQGAWNKYGEDNFSFYVIERCAEDKLNEREIYWIEKYNSNNPEIGYNFSSGGSGNRGVVLTQDQKEYMSQIKNPEKVVQIDFNGNLIRTWRSVTHAQRTLENIRARSILQCCRHKTYQANGHIWFFKNEYEKIEQFNVKEYMYRHNKHFDIPILQYDLFGNLIKEWTQKDLKDSGYNINGIKRCCRHERNIFDDYIWVYKYDTEFKFTDEFLYHCRKACGLYYIDQYDKDMNFIKTWSAKDLRDDGNNIYAINKVCRNEYKCDTYKGYIWKDHIGRYEEAV